MNQTCHNRHRLRRVSQLAEWYLHTLDSQGLSDEAMCFRGVEVTSLSDAQNLLQVIADRSTHSETAELIRAWVLTGIRQALTPPT
jgi:hypothetical protein